MAEKRILMITKQVCPYCERAKRILNEGLDGKYNKDIEMFVREDDEKRFSDLKEKYQFLTVPTFIDKKTGKLLSDSHEETITSFLKQAVGY